MPARGDRRASASRACPSISSTTTRIGMTWRHQGRAAAKNAGLLRQGDRGTARLYRARPAGRVSAPANRAGRLPEAVSARDALALREAGHGRAHAQGRRRDSRRSSSRRGYAQPKSRAEFDRAMKELQEKFLALKVDELARPVHLRVGHDGASMARRAARGAHACAARGGVSHRAALISRSPHSRAKEASREFSVSHRSWWTPPRAGSRARG